MTTLRFYGGVGEIGGNKILLEDGGTRFWLDFGLSFGRMGEYYAEFLKPRTPAGLGDYLGFDITPRLGGVYREDLLRPTDLSYEKPKFGGVLLTHAHIDHAGCIPFLDPGIPIYCSPLTQRILGAYQRTGRGGSQRSFWGASGGPLGPTYTTAGGGPSDVNSESPPRPPTGENI